MKTLTITVLTLCIYVTSPAQGTYHNDEMEPWGNPPAKTEVKKEQRFERGDLTGPRAKNHPTHRYKPSKLVVEKSATASERRMGPAAKNYKPWQDTVRQQPLTITKKKKKNLKGPRAKNYKPWDD